MPFHFIEGTELPPDEIRALFRKAAELKANRRPLPPPLEGKVLGLIFEKASVRTRVSFEVAMAELGGANVYMDQQGSRLGERESVKDVARVLSSYVSALVLRTFSHEAIQETARHSSIPVINGLSDRLHPCQALGDLFTMEERLGGLEGARLAFIGDGNNVSRSLAIACRLLGVEFRIASPEGYGLDADFLAALSRIPCPGPAPIRLRDPQAAARGADALYTDVWVSMGQEEEAGVRREKFEAYRIDEPLLRLASKRAIVLHCLPARRGLEIADDVLDGPRSAVYQQAENRLHVQKALLLRALVG